MKVTLRLMIKSIQTLSQNLSLKFKMKKSTYLKKNTLKMKIIILLDFTNRVKLRIIQNFV